MTYRACAANVVRDVRDRVQSASLTLIIARCAERFGMWDVAMRAMQGNDMFFNGEEPCADNTEEQCLVWNNVVVSAPLEISLGKEGVAAQRSREAGRSSST